MTDGQHPQPPLTQEEQQLLDERRLHTLESLGKLLDSDDDGGRSRNQEIQQQKLQQSTGTASSFSPSPDHLSDLVEQQSPLNLTSDQDSTGQRKARQETCLLRGSSGGVRSSKVISLRAAIRSVGCNNKYRAMFLRMREAHLKRDAERRRLGQQQEPEEFCLVRSRCCNLKKQED